MPALFIKRVFAFCIDYMVILVYVVGLYLASTLLHSLNVDLSFESPFHQQLLGFFTLTLPVFLYFFLNEKYRSSTVGKRLMDLVIQKNVLEKKSNIFLRNLLKFLPWEIAHTGVYFLFYFDKHNQEIPIWLWFVLIVPQIVILIYLLSILFSKGKSSLYDLIANTKISLRSS
ncbi:RDD family protein [Pseudotenacibaculum haliotis]|uniref:RDD family protein n=1 Tax=Pseudotenacibaculum haliotis TaxID=1862138 RepID=A0ABW5LNK9_9FLAO